MPVRRLARRDEHCVAVNSRRRSYSSIEPASAGVAPAARCGDRYDGSESRHDSRRRSHSHLLSRVQQPADRLPIPTCLRGSQHSANTERIFIAAENDVSAVITGNGSTVLPDWADLHNSG